MKDCSDYLLCSDYDGTLYVGHINEKNVTAIQAFMKHGGHFTLCTGRMGEHTHQPPLLPFEINAPMIGLSGAQIYDTQAKRTIEANYLDNGWSALLDELVEKIEGNVFFDLIGKSATHRLHLSDKQEWGKMIESALSDSIYAIIGCTSHTGADPIAPVVEKICGDRYNVTANSPAAYVVTALGINKGYGARRVKEMVGAKKLICVGDYIGDISMLRSADISYAVGNALEQVKSAADHVTLSARDGAIAQIIEKLFL